MNAVKIGIAAKEHKERKKKTKKNLTQRRKGSDLKMRSLVKPRSGAIFIA
jgi:hypothetical protein